MTKFVYFCVLTIAYLYDDYLQMLKPLIAAKNDFLAAQNHQELGRVSGAQKNGLTATNIFH